MKTIYKVEQSDLVEQIKDFPIEVVEKMIEEQVKQGNKADVSVFQKYCISSKDEGGFDWEKTTDWSAFWRSVISHQDFNVFFNKYPKKPNLVYIVGDSEVGMNIIKTLEKYGGINRHDLEGSSDGTLYFIDPSTNSIEVCDSELLYEVLMATYQPIDAEEIIVELSMEEIAEKFGIDVNNLRIK